MRLTERTLQCDRVSLHALDSGIWDHSLAVLQDRSNANLLPLNGNLNETCKETICTGELVPLALAAI